MRSLLWVSIGVAASLGACGQSLSGNLTGTGGAGAITGTGAGTGSGGKGETGAGGTAGYNPAACTALAAEYDAAMTAARSCTAGSTTECMFPVVSSLSACGACPAFVTDASKLYAIQQMWRDANCDRPTPVPPCLSGPCPSGIPDVCIPGPNGQGLCSFATGTGGTTGGTGGRSGAGGGTGAGGSPVDGGQGDTCNGYAAKYGIVLASAQSCTFGAAGQCTHAVPRWLSVCSSGCNTYVNDSTDLDLLRHLWEQAGCGNALLECPAIACLPAAGGVCSQTDAGGGTCTTTYPIAF